MRDFERAYRGADHPGATTGLDIVTTGAIDKREVCVYRPPKKAPPPIPPAPVPRRRRGSAMGAPSNSSSSSSSDPAPWFSRDSESKRRRRVAAYKAHGAESKLKDAVRRGLRWIKVRCSGIVQGQ